MSGLLPTRSGGVPTAAFLQVSDRCNYSCVHCYQVQGERGELSTDEVKRLLDSLAAAGTLFLTLSGGEVTLRPDFLELVTYARKLRFAVSVMTNGYLVDEVLARRLADAAVLDVQISIYSADPDVHDSVTLVPGSFERTIAGVRALRRHGVTVVLKMPLMTVNGDGYRQFIELARAEDCFFSIDPSLIVREDGARGPLALRAPEPVLERFHSDPAFRLESPPAPTPLEEESCRPCSSVMVTADGTIRPCPLLPFSMGNVRDGAIADACGSSTAARFFEALRWSDLPACRVCDLRGYCTRCHAAALLEDGDIFGPSTAACRLASVRFRELVPSADGSSDPEIGPFEIVGGSGLAQRSWDRGDRQIPAEVASAMVVGRQTDRGSGKPRLRLRVLRSAA